MVPDCLARRASSLGASSTRLVERRVAHTRTRARSLSNRAGPIPSTSPSWSTLVNAPFSARHATIAAAVTGPTPGSASSCSAVAVLRSSGAPDDCVDPPAGAVAVSPVGDDGAADRTAQCGGLPGCRCEADDDLLAVGQPARQVETDSVGAVKRAAGRRHRVVHPRTRGQGDQSRRLDQADDADHDRLPGGRRGCVGEHTG